MKRSRRWAIGSLALAACVGTETGNPSFDGTLSYNTYTTNAQQVALVDGEDTAIVVERAWLVLGDVGFVAGELCGPEAEPTDHAQALGAGDHATSDAARTSVTLDATRYCGVHLPFDIAANPVSGAPDDLIDHSVYVNGTLADGRPFAITSAFQGDVFLMADSDFEMDATQSQVLIGFDVATWLADLDWDNAVEDGDGSIQVNDDNNRSLLEGFEQNLSRGTSLFRDVDGTGQVTVTSTRLAVGAP